MVAAMVFFALEDVLLKQLASTVPVGQVLALTGIGGGVIFGVITLAGGKALLSPALLSRPVLLRNACEAVGSSAFLTALALSTLSGASAILQATPLAMTLGAALFFRESVGWRRWTAIALGFAGVLLIIQPGRGSFSPASVFAVVSVLMLAMRDLCSRAVPREIASVQIAAWGFLSLVPAGIAVMAVTGTAPVAMQAPQLLRLAAVFLVGSLGYYAIVAATRTGEVSAVVPFRYTRLVFALVLAWFVFDERPDAMMLTGAAVVVATGLYTIWRSAVVARRPLHSGQ
jgi:drug/metabolite transporter (DMT)-like permease